MNVYKLLLYLLTNHYSRACIFACHSKWIWQDYHFVCAEITGNVQEAAITHNYVNSFKLIFKVKFSWNVCKIVVVQYILYKYLNWNPTRIFTETKMGILMEIIVSHKSLGICIQQKTLFIHIWTHIYRCQSWMTCLFKLTGKITRKPQQNFLKTL